MWFHVSFPDLHEALGPPSSVAVLAETPEAAVEKARGTAESARPGSRARGLLERAEASEGREP